MPRLSRRAVLRTGLGAVSAILFGLPGGRLPATASPGSRPEDISRIDFLALFFERIRSEVKPGLLIAIPRDPDRAAQLRQGLTHVFQTGDLGLFTQAVFACLPAVTVERIIGSVASDVSMVPYDLRGRPSEPITMAPTSIADEFRGRSRELLLGHADSGLSGLIEAQSSGLSGDVLRRVREAVDDLDADDPKVRDCATALLFRWAPQLPAFVYHEYLRATSLERRCRLGRIVLSMTPRYTDQECDPLIPLGTTWVCPPDSAGFLASTNLLARRYLRFTAA